MISDLDLPKLLKPSGKKKLNNMNSWVEGGKFLTRQDFVKSESYDEFVRELEIHCAMGEFLGRREDLDNDYGWEGLDDDGTIYHNLAKVIVDLKHEISNLQGQLDSVDQTLRHYNLNGDPEY